MEECSAKAYLDVNAFESLGVEAWPERLNFNTGGGEDSLDLVSGDVDSFVLEDQGSINNSEFLLGSHFEQYTSPKGSLSSTENNVPKISVRKCNGNGIEYTTVTKPTKENERPIRNIYFNKKQNQI